MRHTMAFVREFSEEDCRQLRRRRLQLGLSYSALSRFIGASATTLRKWEYGQTRRCSSLYSGRLARFLQGGYDQCFESRRGDLRVGSYLVPPSRQLQEAINTLAHSYRFIQSRPDLCAILLQAVNDAANRAVGRYYRQQRR